jgi:hypothetical protein
MTQLLIRIKNLENKILPKNKIMTMVLIKPDSEVEVIQRYEMELGKIDLREIKDKIIIHYDAGISGTKEKSSLDIR